ncbi:MAG TPA: hypothetical protein VGE95_18410 [Arthrobacter sp.]
MLLPQVLRTAPLADEVTRSLLRRTALSYGMDELALLASWKQFNAAPRRPDADVLFNWAEQRLLAQLSQTPGEVLARVLPSWQLEPQAFGRAADAEVPRARWQAGSAARRWRSAAGCAPPAAPAAPSRWMRYLPG